MRVTSASGKSNFERSMTDSWQVCESASPRGRAKKDTRRRATRTSSQVATPVGSKTLAVSCDNFHYSETCCSQVCGMVIAHTQNSKSNRTNFWWHKWRNMTNVYKPMHQSVPLCEDVLKKKNPSQGYVHWPQREEGREGKTGRGRKIDVRETQSIASHTLRTRDWTCILGTCPDWGLNAQPFGV